MGDDDTRQKMSVMASAAAWGLGQWDSMEEYVRSIPKSTMEGSFYQSLLHIHHRQFDSAQKVWSKDGHRVEIELVFKRSNSSVISN